MRIFLSFLQSTIKHPIAAYNFWEHYIKNGIEEAGHEWIECPDVDWALGLVPQSDAHHTKWKSEAWSKTVECLRAKPADMFLSYLYPEQIEVGAIREIQKMGIPCVNFYCDNVRQFKTAPIEFAVFDLNWVPEYKAGKLYQKAGYPYINLPMPIWVDPKLRVAQRETNQEITFIGSKDIQRRLLFEDIIKQNPEINLAIYGKGWDETTLHPPAITGYAISKKMHHQYRFIKTHGVVAYARKLGQRNTSGLLTPSLKSKIRGLVNFEDYNKLTSQSMITVGINRYPSFQFPLSSPDTYSRLRDVEAPMLGACYLTEYTEGLEDLYVPGKEIEVYLTAEDFIDKVTQLKHDLQQRKALRANGQKRALHDHSIPSSLKKIRCTVGL
jgi:hypothetical protein